MGLFNRKKTWNGMEVYEEKEEKMIGKPKGFDKQKAWETTKKIGHTSAEFGKSAFNTMGDVLGSMYENAEKHKGRKK